MASAQASLKAVISVCSQKDLEVWSRASQLIPRFIMADHYIVIVPEAEVDLFRARTNAAVEVRGESFYTRNISPLLKERRKQHPEMRFGWYLQQFIKLNALLDYADEENVLIWDADTVPLKPLNFVNGPILRYYKSKEYNSGYFDLIHDVSGLKKTVDFSFIAQCFPVKVGHFRSFCHFVENYNNSSNWYEAIIDKIDFSGAPHFSEYETLGTYIAYAFPENIEFLDNRWCRLGNTLLGDLNQLTENAITSLARRYDFISFEWWDSRSIKSIIRFILYDRILNQNR